jgi:hypothetical protein
MYEKFLTEIEEEEASSGEQMEPGASAAQTASLKETALRELGAELPAGYLDFLGRHNGLIYNGLNIYGTEQRKAAGDDPDVFIEGFTEANLDYRDVDYFSDLLVFGDGDIDLYVYQVSKNEYQVRDRIPADNIYETFRTFEELIAHALEKYL